MRTESNARQAMAAALLVATSCGCAALLKTSNPNDQGITSEVHGANVGKMVFSTKPIEFGAEQPAAFASSFKAGQELYGRLYLASSLTTQLAARGQGIDKNGALDVRFSIAADGQELGTSTQPSAFRRDYTTYSFALLTSNPSDYMEATWFRRQLETLSAGEHTVVVKALGPKGLDGAVLAEGSFTFEQSAEVAAKNAEREAKLKASLAEGAAKIAAGFRSLDLNTAFCDAAAVRWRITQAVTEKGRTSQKLVYEGDARAQWVQVGARFMLYDPRGASERIIFSGQVTDTPNEQRYRWDCQQHRLAN